MEEALSHRETIPIPCYINFTPPMEMRVKDYYHTEDLNNVLGNYISWLQAVPVIPDGLIGDSYTDCFGVRWANVGATRGYVVEHPLAEPSLKDYEFPEPCPAKRVQELKQSLQTDRDLFKIVKLGDLYERANFLRGMDKLMVDMYLHPDFVDDLFEKLLDFNISVVDRLDGLSIDALSLSDDYGHERGLLISPKLWRRFIKPRLLTLVNEIKEKGFYAFLHSDGDVSAIVPDLIEIGFDAIHPVQPEAMNLAFLKQKYGSSLTFFGGFSTQRTFPLSTPTEISRHVAQTVKTLGKGGGFIISPGICMMEDVPLENAVAFIETVRNNRGVDTEELW